MGKASRRKRERRKSGPVALPPEVLQHLAETGQRSFASGSLINRAGCALRFHPTPEEPKEAPRYPRIIHGSEKLLRGIADDGFDFSELGLSLLPEGAPNVVPMPARVLGEMFAAHEPTARAAGEMSGAGALISVLASVEGIVDSSPDASFSLHRNVVPSQVPLEAADRTFSLLREGDTTSAFAGIFRTSSSDFGYLLRYANRSRLVGVASVEMGTFVGRWNYNAARTEEELDAAMMWAEPEAPRPMLRSIWVARNYRGRGIAREILQTIPSDAKDLLLVLPFSLNGLAFARSIQPQGALIGVSENLLGGGVSEVKV